VVPISCDVTSLPSIRAAAEQVEKEIGYVDVLINNAGVGGPYQGALYAAETNNIKKVQEILLSNYDDNAGTFATNSISIMGVSAAFLHLLDAGNQRRGWESGEVLRDRARKRDIAKAKEAGVEENDLRTSQIISVTSIAAFNRHVTQGLMYSTSKAAGTHLGKMLSTLLAPWGIRSNVIAPGGKSVHYYSTPFELDSSCDGRLDELNET
jgi:NAD(P)-dependent dehydrogenase (short-subunit alcohol dehydrogenase family)